MTIDTDTFECYSVGVWIVMNEWDPLNSWRQMACRVETSYLKITTVFSEAQAEHSFFNQFLLVHYIENRFHVRTRRRGSSHSKNAICLLSIEKIGFNGHTPKCKVKCVLSQVILLSEMNNVLYYKPLVQTSFAVLLSKGTHATLHALARTFSIALIYVFAPGLVQIHI